MEFEAEGGGDSLPPVFTTVPTEERIVFLTREDGDDRDPELPRMTTELGIPYSASLRDYLVRNDYGHFKEMQNRGVTLNSHTLNHPYLRGVSRSRQRSGICGRQDSIEKEFGRRPTLFRPPYGTRDGGTLRLAKSCGIKAVPLWAEEVFPDPMEWREWDRDLRPGDIIILTHFRGRKDWDGSMPGLVRAVMRTITDKGYAVARLEDYV
jgi:peptidoglycan/xylan/chitin deacetylase (PgdA/CDA1 family)